MQADGVKRMNLNYMTLFSQRAQRLNPLLIIQAFVNHNGCEVQKSICALGGLSIYHDNCTPTICCQLVCSALCDVLKSVQGRDVGLVF